MNNFLLLYNIDSDPYQPTSSWGVHNGFKPDEFLNSPKKEFISDTLLSPHVNFVTCVYYNKLRE